MPTEPLSDAQLAREFAVGVVASNIIVGLRIHEKDSVKWVSGLLDEYAAHVTAALRAAAQGENERLKVADEHLRVAKQLLNVIVGEGNSILPLISRVEALAKRAEAESQRVAELEQALRALLPNLTGHQEFAGDLYRCAVCDKASSDGTKHNDGCEYVAAERVLSSGPRKSCLTEEAHRLTELASLREEGSHAE